MSNENDKGDPLDDLFPRVAKSAAEVFEPRTFEALRALKQRDPQHYEETRARLKTMKGVRIGELDKAIARDNGEMRARAQADMLIDLAKEDEFFRDGAGIAYVDVPVDGHRETWKVNSKAYKEIEIQRFYKATGSAPNSEAMTAAIGSLRAKARFERITREVYVRVGALPDLGVIYVDLCNDKWEAVAISKTGWKVVSEPAIGFRRERGMLALPSPVHGGSIHALRPFLNLKNEHDFVLVVHWILAALRGEGPYPVLALAGEQGSAKSTTTKIIRSLVDPNVASLRSTPREERDLFIAANNSHVLALDNVSGLPTWISDTMCRISTGGGFSSRQLFTDDEESMFNLMRPQIINGIEDMVTRPDLADRSLLLTLDPIPDSERRTEAKMWADFESERPKIMGALLDAVVQGLIALPNTHLPRMPRMADFATWSVACETALWPAGTFMRAYEENRAEAVEQIIEASAIASTVRQLMSNRLEWKSSASELLTKLTEMVDPQTAKSRGWPKAANALSRQLLRRVASTMRRTGIEIESLCEGHRRDRKIRIFRSRLGAQSSNGTDVDIPSGGPEEGKTSSASSASSAPNGSNGLGADDHGTGIVRNRQQDRRHGDPLDIFDAADDDAGGADDHEIEDRQH